MFLTDTSGTLSILEDWYLVQSKPQAEIHTIYLVFRACTNLSENRAGYSGTWLETVKFRHPAWKTGWTDTPFARTQSWCHGGVWRSLQSLLDSPVNQARGVLGIQGWVWAGESLCKKQNISAIQTWTWISQPPSTEGGPSGYTTTWAPDRCCTFTERSLSGLRWARTAAVNALITARSYSSLSAFCSVQSWETETVPRTPSRSKESSKISSPFQEPSETLLEQ